MMVMLSHGLVSGALFLCVGVIYDRLHTREISRYGGLAINMPRYALFFLLFTMASIGLPGTSGFVGEFLSADGHLPGVDLDRAALHDRASSWARRTCCISIAASCSARSSRTRSRAMPDLSRPRAVAARADRGGGAVDGRLSRKLPGADAQGRRRRCSRGSTARRRPAIRSRPRASPPRRRSCRARGGALMDYAANLAMTLPEVVLGARRDRADAGRRLGRAGVDARGVAGPRSRCWRARASR